MAAGGGKALYTGPPGPDSGSVPYFHCDTIRTLPPASWPQTVLGGQGEALVALNPQRYPGSFSGFAHSAGLGLSVLLPSQSAFQPSQHFWAPPTFISFPACGLGTEGKSTCPSWGQCQAMLRLRPVGPQNPQDVVWLRVCLSVGWGVCEQLCLWGGLWERNSLQAILNCLRSLLWVSKGLPRPKSPPLLSGCQKSPERNWSQNDPLGLG